MSSQNNNDSTNGLSRTELHQHRLYQEQIEKEDADYALALQQQIDEERHVLEQAQRSRATSTNNSHNVTNSLNYNIDARNRNTIQDDEELARNLQEMEDREGLRMLQYSSERAATATTRRRSSLCQKLCRCISVVTITLCATYAFIFYVFPSFGYYPFQGTNGPFGDLKGIGTGIFGGGGNSNWVDEWVDGTQQWRTRSDGLELTIVNALTEDWYDEFNEAVNQWNKSDALLLKTIMAEESPDYDCDGLRNQMKVCNGDYGSTSWVGINIIILENGFISRSSAKMNDFYLSTESQAKKQYTMCHEIGHGFGLPHTDENFFNKDQGNCLDYTMTPQNNMNPDERNFDKLREVYGSIDQKSIPIVPSKNVNVNDKESGSINYDDGIVKYEQGDWKNGNYRKWKHAKNSHNGLELTLVNALSADWHPFFNQAYSDWEEATALKLSLDVREYDLKCKPEKEILKVCNADYGETEWVGINEIVVDEKDLIIMSTAKMNDFHLQELTNSKRQYTMCHEIGHGFGLAHTDDNFSNKDSGNCLDYTQNPHNNIHPGLINFITLEDMYGTISNEKEDKSSLDTKKQKNTEGKKDEDNDEHDRNRFLRPWEPNNYLSYATLSYPLIEETEWNLVSRSEFDEIHEANLGSGRKIVAQIILA